MIWDLKHKVLRRVLELMYSNIWTNSSIMQRPSFKRSLESPHEEITSLCGYIVQWKAFVVLVCLVVSVQVCANREDPVWAQEQNREKQTETESKRVRERVRREQSGNTISLFPSKLIVKVVVATGMWAVPVSLHISGWWPAYLRDSLSFHLPSVETLQNHFVTQMDVSNCSSSYVQHIQVGFDAFKHVHILSLYDTDCESHL